MKRYLIPTYITIFLIGATALWYFGHHRPAQKILEAEPKRVYKSTPLQPKNLPVTSTSSDPTHGLNEAETDIETEAIDIESEDMDSAVTSEKIDNSQNRSADSGSDAFIPQEALSSASHGALSPKEAAAIKAYEEAQSEYLAAQDILQAALDARPIDWDRVSSASNNFKNAARNRKEALQDLAPYSEDAARLLKKIKDAEKRSDEKRAEFDSEIRSLNSEIRSLKYTLRDLKDIIENPR